MACCEKVTNLVSEYLYRFLSDDVSCGSSQGAGLVVSNDAFEIDCVSYNPGDIGQLVQAKLLSGASDASEGLTSQIRLHFFSVDPGLVAGDTVATSFGFEYLGYVDFIDFYTVADSGTGLSFSISFAAFPDNFKGYLTPALQSRVIYGVLQNASGGTVDFTNKILKVELIFRK